MKNIFLYIILTVFPFLQYSCSSKAQTAINDKNNYLLEQMYNRNEIDEQHLDTVQIILSNEYFDQGTSTSYIYSSIKYFEESKKFSDNKYKVTLSNGREISRNEVIQHNIDVFHSYISKVQDFIVYIKSQDTTNYFNIMKMNYQDSLVYYDSYEGINKRYFYLINESFLTSNYYSYSIESIAGDSDIPLQLEINEEIYRGIKDLSNDQYINSLEMLISYTNFFESIIKKWERNISEYNNARLKQFYLKFMNQFLNIDMFDIKNRLLLLDIISNPIDSYSIIENHLQINETSDSFLPLVKEKISNFYKQQGMNLNSDNLVKIQENFLINEIEALNPFVSKGDRKANLDDLEKSIQKIIINNSLLFRLNSIFDSTSSGIKTFLTDNLFDIGISYNNSLNASSLSLLDSIMIDISVLKFSSNIDPNYSKNKIYSKYFLRTRTEPNPEYNVAQLEVNSAQNQVNSNNREEDLEGLAGIFQEIGRDMAESTLTDAQVKLAQTPTTIKVNDYQEYSFDKITHSVSATLSLNIIISYKDYKDTLIADYSINKKPYSYIGVASNDENGYTERVISLPTKLMLMNQLSKQFVNEAIIFSNSFVSQLKKQNQFDYSIIHIGDNRLVTFIEKDVTLNSNFKSFIDFNLNSMFDINFNKSVNLNHDKKSFLKLKDVIKYCKSASSQVLAYNDQYESSFGSGYFISNDGYFITNSHVVRNSKVGNYANIILNKKNNNRIEVKNAKLIYYDEDLDLALLKTNGSFDNTNSIIINEDTAIEMGDEIIYVGYPSTPITSLKDADPFASRGIVSQTLKDDENNPLLILLDLTANQGSSGSAVVNQNTGELVSTITWGSGRQVNIFELLSNYEVNIRESQNFGTSNSVLLNFLNDSPVLFE